MGGGILDGGSFEDQELVQAANGCNRACRGTRLEPSSVKKLEKPGNVCGLDAQQAGRTQMQAIHVEIVLVSLQRIVCDALLDPHVLKKLFRPLLVRHRLLLVRRPAAFVHDFTARRLKTSRSSPNS